MRSAGVQGRVSTADLRCVLCRPMLCCLGSLLQLQSRQRQMEGELASKQQQAGELVKDFKAVEDQVDKVGVWPHTAADQLAAACWAYMQHVSQGTVMAQAQTC